MQAPKNLRKDKKTKISIKSLRNLCTMDTFVHGDVEVI